MECHKLFNDFYVWDDLWCNTTSQGSCIPTVSQWKPCRDLERQCDVTLPTPRASFSFTPQFGISLFSCFSSPPYSPVALCVFNRIFSPKKNIFTISPQILFQVSCSRTAVIFTEAHLFILPFIQDIIATEGAERVIVLIKVCTTL